MYIFPLNKIDMLHTAILILPRTCFGCLIYSEMSLLVLLCSVNDVHFIFLNKVKSYKLGLHSSNIPLTLKFVVTIY